MLQVCSKCQHDSNVSGQAAAFFEKHPVQKLTIVGS